MQTIGVIGAGLMGNGIAHVAALAGYDVILSDVALARAEAARATIAKNLGRGVTKGVVTQGDADAALADRRQQATAALDEVRALGGLAMDVADAPARWDDVVRALAAGAGVTLLRDGQALAAITPFETQV